MELNYTWQPIRILYVTREEEDIPFFIDRLAKSSAFWVTTVCPDRLIEDKKTVNLIERFDPDFVLTGKDPQEIKKLVGSKIYPFDFLKTERFVSKYESLLKSYALFLSDKSDLTATGHVNAQKLNRFFVGKKGETPGSESVVAYPDNVCIKDLGSFVIPSFRGNFPVARVKFTDSTGNKNTYRLPFTPPFRKLISRYNNDSLLLRMCAPEKSGSFALLSPVGNALPSSFQLPPLSGLLAETFETAGYSVRTTHLENHISMFSGLKPAGKFYSSPYAVPLVNSLTANDYGVFGSVRKIFSRLGNLDSVDTSREILKLLNKRILLRGYTIECPQCNSVNFYFMNEVDEKFTCRSCRKTAVAPLKLKSAFKLNQVVSESYRQGSIATILTLYHLYCRAENSFIYSGELRLKKGQEEMEIDVVCLVDGELVIGEAKTGKLIKDRDFSTRDEFDKYKKLAKELNAHRVVFSTMSDGFYEVPRSKIDRFEKELDREGYCSVKVEVLSSNELVGN